MIMNDLTYRRALIEGDPSTPSEISYAYHDAQPDSTPRGTLLLIHGFPERAYQFRHVIPQFKDAGYRVIAPDYRGAGHSSRLRSGFDKVTIARDHYKLLTEHLGIKEKVHVVGHDIGGMIAHAFASRYADNCASIAWGECPIPGSKVYEEFLLSVSGNPSQEDLYPS
jgi:pimeloyl-ACP methyl ester carboxylesterase